jgi:hypothetical protein
MKQQVLDAIAYGERGMSKEEFAKTGGLNNPIANALTQMGEKMATIATRQMQAKKEQNAKVAKYIDQLQSDVDVTRLTPQMQDSVGEYLVGLRQEYANAAMNIVNYDAGTPEYMRYVSTMNNVNNSVQNLSSQIKLYNERKTGFVEDFQNGIISDGNDFGEYRSLSNIYTNDTMMRIGQSGNLMFSDAEGNFKSFNDIPQYFEKDYDSANKIIKMMSDVYSAGTKLDEAREKMIRMQLNSLISQGGRGTLLSLASDNFFNDGGLGIVDPRYYDRENEEALKEKVIDSYVEGIRDAANDGAKKATKNTKAKGGRLTAGQQKLQQMQNLIVNNQDVIINGINTLAGKEEIEFIDLYNLGTELGLDVNKVEDSGGDIIGYQFEHPLVKLPVSISLQQLNNPKSVSTVLLRSLGTDYLGLNPSSLISFETPQTEETESDLPIIE